MNRTPIIPRILLSAILAFNFGTHFAHAETKTWLATGAWTDGTKWSPAGAPTVSGTDSVVTGTTTAVSGVNMWIDTSPTVASWTANTGGTAFTVTGTGGGARSLTIGSFTKNDAQDITFRSNGSVGTATTLSLTFDSINVTAGRVVLGGTGAGQALTSVNVTGTTTVSTSGAAVGLTVIAGSPNSINLGHLDLQVGTAGLTLNGGGAGSSGGATVTGLSGTTGLVAGGVNLGTAVSGTLVIASSGSSSFSGALRNYGNQSGGGTAPVISTMSLVKTGTGTQSLGGLNSYKGGTTINGGVLSVNSLANGDLVTVNATSTNGSNILVVSSTNGLSVGQVILGYQTTSSNPVTITAIFSGSVQLSSNANVTGTADRMFGTQNALGLSTTDASGLVINGGTLQFTGTNASLAGTDRLFTLGADGGELDASGSVAMSFSSTGAVAFAGSGGRTLTLSGTNTGNNTLAASLGNGTGGATSVVKSGAGKWVLSGSSAYSGGTAVNAGTLLVSHASGAGAGSVTLGGGALQVNVNGGNGAITNAVTFTSALSTYVLERATGTSFSAYAASSDLTGGIDTTAAMLAGTAGAARTLTTSFSTISTAGNDGGRVSDVFSLDGTDTDVFVLQLEIADVSEGMFLAWLDGSDTWVNAVTGNSATGGSAITGYAGSFAASGASATADYLGSWGYDTASNTVWAVLDHNSEFAIIVVPEPSTWTLFGLGLGTLLLRARCRRGSDLS